VAVIAVLLALGTGGCTQDQPETEVTAPTFADASPRPSEAGPSASAPAEPSPAPTEAAPPLPDLAKQQTPEGAVAFTQWWFETLNYATATGDTTGLRAASDPECIFCGNLATRAESAYAAGTIDGGLATVEFTQPGAIQELGVNIAVFADVQETRILNSEGKVIETLTASSDLILTATLLLTASGWLMGAVAE